MKKINIGIVGAGLMCKAHSAALALMPVYFPHDVIGVRKALCDANMDIATASAEQYQWEEPVATWQEMVERKDIDLIDIVTPNFMHAEIAIAAIKNGKMVYCEKPLANTLEGARRMKEEAQNAGVRTAIGFNKRRWPAVAYAKQLVDSGFIGTPLFFNGMYLQDTNLDPNGPLTWRFRKEKSGGIAEVGSHIIDMSRFFMGDVEEVVAQADIYTKMRPLVPNPDRCGPSEILDQKGEADVEETFLFMEKHKNKSMSNIVLTTVASGMGDGISFDIWGTKGAIRWNGQRANELQVSDETDPLDKRGFKTIEMAVAHPYGSALWPLPFGTGFADNKALEMHDILTAFANDEPYSPDFFDGFKVATIANAVQESLDKKQWIKVQD